MRRSALAAAEFVAGAAVGFAVGYAAALLLAPYEGGESRLLLQARAEALKERPRRVAGQVQARVERAVEEGRRAAAETRAELESAAGAGLAESKAQREGPASSI